MALNPTYWNAYPSSAKEHSVWCVMSHLAPVKSGVTQGSVIGLILFLIHINDLPEEFKSTVHLFADGTIMYMTMTSTSNAASLQNNLDNLASWEKKCAMQFHTQKM